MTILTCALCIGVPAIGVIVLDPGDPVAFGSMVVIPLVVLAASAGFMVRAYTVTGDGLIIHRLGWFTRLALSSLTDVEIDPLALQGSIRVAGNGGAFALSGLFSNEKFGSFLVYATDPKRSVVLRFADRVVVVTPEDPERFVDLINSARLATRKDAFNTWDPPNI